jgi:hypothetical protein
MGYPGRSGGRPAGEGRGKRGWARAGRRARAAGRYATVAVGFCQGLIDVVTFVVHRL